VPLRAFRLDARVSTENPRAIPAALKAALPTAAIAREQDEFRVQATVRGNSARELNRELLSALRRVERKTRLRAEWTAGRTTERFFDYVPKGSRPSATEPAGRKP